MRQSKKNQLIAAMIESGKPWRFTDMQKFLWNLKYPNVPFTRDQRGFWSTNFVDSSNSNWPWRSATKGYMLHGGDGRVYKTEQGWMAEWHSKNIPQLES